MPQLDTSTFPSQLFWLGVCFLVLYLILSYIAVPKMTRILETREEILEEKINKASTYREQAEGLLADYEATLTKAREKAQHQYQSATRVTAGEIAQKKKVLLDKLNNRLNIAEQNLYRARLEASTEINSVAVEVAISILKKLTGHTYSSDDLLVKREEA